MTEEQKTAYATVDAKLTALKALSEGTVGSESMRTMSVFVTALCDKNYKVVYDCAEAALNVVQTQLTAFTELATAIQQIITLGEPVASLVMNPVVKASYHDPSTCLCRHCKNLHAVVSEDEEEDPTYVCNACSQVAKALAKNYSTTDIVTAFKVDPDGCCSRFISRGTEEVESIDVLKPEEEEEETTEEETPVVPTEAEGSSNLVEGQQNTDLVNPTEPTNN